MLQSQITGTQFTIQSQLSPSVISLLKLKILMCWTELDGTVDGIC